ncbi:MAG: hypothetical protein QNJ07_13370 [Woeseiaceae bacterium]|nr:hypothetical protein [Woeseiaceae bacterium]
MLLVGDISRTMLTSLLERYELELVVQPDNAPITASFWGESEAGIAGQTVYVRHDTPVHSLLHETCHVICMDRERRESLHRDAGGDDIEEAAVCYLQIVLADWIEGAGGERIMRDMDDWGYSFRLGSTSRWWHEDAGDARGWLLSEGLLTGDGTPVFRLRN